MRRRSPRRTTSRCWIPSTPLSGIRKSGTPWSRPRTPEAIIEESRSGGLRSRGLGNEVTIRLLERSYSSVLTKIESRVVRQPDSRVRRAWYQSAQADVVLLHDAETGTLLSFELEWESRRGVRRAHLTWTRGVG